MTHHVIINGIPVDADFSNEAISTIFQPLLVRLHSMQETKGSRLLVMLAAPPGAGKTTLLSFLKTLDPSIQTIGMDGFHKRQEYLTTHFTEIDGQQIPLVQIKGAPITFDQEKLTERIKRVAAGEIVGWPTYNRMLHNPEDNTITVDHDIVILEGNYLLLDEDGWRDLSAYADYTISISADEVFLRQRLIPRRVKTGVGEDEATRFVDFSDMANVRLCLRHSKKADLSLRLDYDGEFWIKDGK